MGKWDFKGTPEGVKEALQLPHRLQSKVASIRDTGTIPNISGHRAVSKALHLPFCTLEGHPTGNLLD